jgi:uncharacterized membrane protein YphA (DoxX/SURF4 family)
MNNIVEKQKVVSIQNFLKYVFVVVPIVAGLDKFTNLLTNWESYLSPLLLKMLPFSGHTFMMVVGVIEIAAGIMVFAKPRLGSVIVSAWLVLIALSLLSSGHNFDVAVRDLVMAVGAFSLARLTSLVEETDEVPARSQRLVGQKI